MSQRIIKIKRTQYTDKQIIGQGAIVEDCNVIYKFYTLELPWKDNQVNISCIPSGLYPIRKFVSNKLGHCFAVDCVYNRTLIRIHSGNYYTQIEGCILVGSDLKDINADGLKDIINSRTTLRHILKLMPEESYLYIMSKGEISWTYDHLI